MSHIPSISPTRTSPTDRRRGLDRDHNISVRALLEVDTVAILARRTGINPSTITAQLAAWQVGAQS